LIQPGLDASYPQLSKPCSAEIATEGQRIPNPERAHEKEARRIHERVLAFIVLAQPAEGTGVRFLGDSRHLDPRRSLDHVEKIDRSTVTGAPTEKGPCLAAHVVGSYESSAVVRRKEIGSLLVTWITSVAQSDPERRIDKDQP
jgi:hypothetical protein